MSSSSNGYSTKPVSEKGAGGQGDCVPEIGDKLRKQLGIGPDSGREEGSEPLVALPQSIKGAPFNCGILKEIILDQSNTVKIRPVLLTVSGLQESGDTHAITHLMKHYVDKSPYTPISRKTYLPKTANGIINYKLVAVGLHRLQIVEMTSDFSYAFGIMSAFQKKVQDKENPEFPLIDSNTRSEKNASFGDPDLEMHLENVYRHISQFEHFPKGSPTQSDKSVESIIDKLTGEEKALLQHLQKLPDGAALINIWSVDIRKSAFYILHALFGYLYNSNTWLFIDIQQNLKELDDPLEEKQQNDGSFIVKWRSRLHYLLHASKMSHGGCKGYRTQVCTFFAKHDKGNLQIKQDELEEKVHQGARQTGVSDLLEPQVQVISYLNDSQISDDDSQRLYQKFHQVISNRAYKEIPFSWVFLRSLFYCSHKVYISKTALKEKAKECGIIDESFEKFCHFFMSFGSIIDLTCINPEQKIVVLAPVEFLRSLDKIFYPSDEISKQYPMIINGVVSDKVCKEIFEQEGEWAVYIDVLMSIGLAAKVTGVCELKDIKIGSKQRNDALYYIPLIREEVISSPDEIQGANNAVYFIASPDSPHIYKQARLAKFILIDPELAHSELIPCHQKNRTIIRVVYGSTDTTITFVSFSPATLITITENNESKSNDDELFKIYARVIKAFEYITKTGKAGLIKYQFITICSKESEDSDPNKPLHQHVLPNSLCKLCKSHGRLERELKLWNEALKKNPIPDKNKINEGKEVMAGENVKLLQVKITELQKSKETLQEQKKALLLENENLKSLLEGKTRTQKNEEINNEVNVQPHSMKEGDTDATHDSELLSTSTKSLQEKEHIQYSDDDTQFAGIEDKATTKTSDKEVQFNYLVPSEDHLDGLSDSHIAGKKLFLVQGDKPQLMNWEEYGLRISVPEGSLSSSETTEIAVIALVGGHFKFPKNTRLVSAVYAISASHLLNSLKLEVQHCIDLSDPSLCKYLKFAVAPVHTSSLPYQFSIVEGGEFPANSRYGSIERSKFCLLGIVGKDENGGQSNGEQEQNNEGQGQSNGEEGGGDSGDGDSGDEGGKGGGKKKEGQRQQGEEGEGAGQHGGGAGPHGGGECGGVEVNQQQQELLQQEGTDERIKQYQDGEDEVKSKGEGKEAQHKVATLAEAIIYAGQAFYKQKDLMMFIAGKDLNALHEYIERKYHHAKIDQGITFKLDPSLGYVELIFGSPQEEPTTGWSVYPHMKPCQINKDEMAGFEGISNTHPPSRLITIDVAEDNPNTVRMLNYSIPLKGALNRNDVHHQMMKIVIIRSLKDILSGTSSVTTTAPAANIGICAQDALKKNIGDLKDLLSKSKATFCDIASACKEENIISGTEYDEILDGTTRQTLAERVDQFLKMIISILKHCPNQLDVFLSKLKEKGNVGFIRLAERIAQSFNTEVPDQHHIILTES